MGWLRKLLHPEEERQRMVWESKMKKDSARMSAELERWNKENRAWQEEFDREQRNVDGVMEDVAKMDMTDQSNLGLLRQIRGRISTNRYAGAAEQTKIDRMIKKLAMTSEERTAEAMERIAAAEERAADARRREREQRENNNY